MTTISASPKVQVVIAVEIQDELNLLSGQPTEVKLNEGKVEFLTEKTILTYRGRWPNVDSTVVRNQLLKNNPFIYVSNYARPFLHLYVATALVAQQQYRDCFLRPCYLEHSLKATKNMLSDHS